MNTDLIHITLGFVEGLALIASPCILPILPIILSTSLAGNRKRPIGIVIGFVITFAIFTFFIRQLTQLFAIDSIYIRWFAYAMLFALSIIMMSPNLSERFNTKLQGLTNVGSSDTFNQGGLLSGLLFGSLIAVIWTPCAGPILAAIIIQVTLQKTSLMSFITLFAFSLGVAIPMLLIALLGRQFLNYFQFLKNHTRKIRQLLGVTILLSLIYLIFYADKMNENTQITTPHTQATQLQHGLFNPYPTPELAGITAWINSKPLTLQSLRGKVVLIDFWAYSCINCIRTLPYVRHWHQQYKNKGLVVIGVHAPEFDFEKDLNNVQAAVKSQKITYPVALDNQFETWRAFNNQYWPAHYLIDQYGKVVYTHFGEGQYDVMDNNIRYLLKLREKQNVPKIEKNGYSELQTPETYLGYSRADQFASVEGLIPNAITRYSTPTTLERNQWALSGQWQILGERIISAEKNASVTLHFHAKNVFAVMGNTNSEPVRVTLLQNDQRVKEIVVDKHTLYNIIELPQASDGLIKLIADKPGLEIYTFTFGS